MSYVALYRAWRPAKWEDVVDQKPVVRILKNALAEGKVSHAYLFSGPRGTGKTTVARLLSKAVNCENLSESEPCNQCRTCLSIGEGSSVDVIEIDAASNRGIDEIRSLRESVRYVPVMGRYKVYIIDEVHMLTQEAFNALLKTLEEPPDHVIFILATTAPHKIPLTITSRCQRLDFRRLSIPDIEGQLAKVLSSLASSNAAANQDGLPGIEDPAPVLTVTWEKDALRAIARAAKGSLRDALSILDLCLTYGNGKVSFADVREILGETSTESMMRLFRAVSQSDIKTLLEVTEASSDRGKDMGEFCEEIAEFARDLLLIRAGGRTVDVGRPQEEANEMATPAKVFSPAMLIALLEAMARATVEIRNQDDPRLTVEMALLSLFLGGDERVPGTPTAPAFAGLKAPIDSDPQKIARPAEPLQAVKPAAPIGPAPKPEDPIRSAEPPVSSAGIERRAAQSEKPPDVTVTAEQAASSATVAPSETTTMAADVTAPLTDGAILEAVKANWPALLEALAKGRKMMARAYLMPASPHKVEEGKRLVLAYPKRYGTHMEQIMVSDNKTMIENYLERVMKRKLDLKVVMSDLDPRGGGASSEGNGDQSGARNGGNGEDAYEGGSSYSDSGGKKGGEAPTDVYDGSYGDGGNGGSGFNGGDGLNGGNGEAATSTARASENKGDLPAGNGNRAGSSAPDLHPLVKAAITILDGRVVS